MFGRFLSLLRKEFTQLFHDWPILLILAWAYTGAIYVAGHAIRIELKNYPIAVLDYSKSPASRQLVSLLRKPYFKLVGDLSRDAQVREYLDSAKASVVVVIPPDFQRRLAEGGAQIQVISDGSNSQSAILAGGYVTEIAGTYNRDLLEQVLGQKALSVETRFIPRVDARSRVEYNPTLDNGWFSSLLEMLSNTMMVAGLLTAAAMVREKVNGTLEQLLVSPVRPIEVLLAKIVPTLVLVLSFSAVALFGVIHGVFGTPIRGSVPLFYGVMAVYVFAASSLGLAVAVFAPNIAQAMLTLFLILMPMTFLSGGMTPPEAMSPWMRYLSLISPMRYFIDFGNQVLFKGNGLSYVWGDVLGIVIITVGMFWLALWRTRALLR